MGVVRVVGSNHLWQLPESERLEAVPQRAPIDAPNGGDVICILEVRIGPYDVALKVYCRILQ